MCRFFKFNTVYIIIVALINTTLENKRSWVRSPILKLGDILLLCIDYFLSTILARTVTSQHYYVSCLSAYILADQGYDVWIGNARGNKYSRAHTYLDPDTGVDFWDFTWHQIGVYDLPAMIDYVLEQTGQEDMFYIGHSQVIITFFRNNYNL